MINPVPLRSAIPAREHVFPLGHWDSETEHWPATSLRHALLPLKPTGTCLYWRPVIIVKYLSLLETCLYPAGIVRSFDFMQKTVVLFSALLLPYWGCGGAVADWGLVARLPLQLQANPSWLIILRPKDRLRVPAKCLPLTVLTLLVA